MCVCVCVCVWYLCVDFMCISNLEVYVCVRLHVRVFICVCRVYVVCLLNLYLHMILYTHNALLRVIMPETVSVVLV